MERRKRECNRETATANTQQLWRRKKKKKFDCLMFAVCAREREREREFLEAMRGKKKKFIVYKWVSNDGVVLFFNGGADV
jgi:hypothetical protein